MTNSLFVEGVTEALMQTRIMTAMLAGLLLEELEEVGSPTIAVREEMIGQLKDYILRVQQEAEIVESARAHNN